MATTVTLSIEGLPDATATKNDDGSYDVTITGLAGLIENPQEPSSLDLREGIVSFNPPSIHAEDARDVEILLLRAVEGATPAALLENNPADFIVLDQEQLLLVQLTRMWRRLLWKLEPPT